MGEKTEKCEATEKFLQNQTGNRNRHSAGSPPPPATQQIKAYLAKFLVRLLWQQHARLLCVIQRGLDPFIDARARLFVEHVVHNDNDLGAAIEGRAGRADWLVLRHIVKSVGANSQESEKHTREHTHKFKQA